MSEGRVDAWIWAIRVAKTRSAATALCKAGHVRVNGERAKPAQVVRPGDEVRVVLPGARERIVEVRAILTKRVSAALAAPAFLDRTPPPPPRAERVVLAERDRGAGRPTKRDRREIERLRGH
ncbi:MAG: RNA-binding S4 domain-containing protein [Microbacteriaceae bacterium]|nr:RNA-binding S4 domain-containing protein [Microbacteriaceae bacterium]